MKVVPYILFGALFTCTSSLALGLILFRALGLRLRKGEERLLAFVTGSGLLSGIVFVLCCARLARKGVFLAVGVIAIVAAIRMGAHRAQGDPDPLPPIAQKWRWVLGIVFAVFAVLYFFNALAPEMSADGSTYHLVWPEFYYRAHGFVRIPWNMYANLTQGIELLFLYAFSFGRQSAAALVHLAFLIVLPWMMIAYARRAGVPLAGFAGALFFFVSPVVGMDGTVAYVDVALAAVLFALFYFLQIWDERRDAKLLIPIGILMGFGVAVKYTAFVAIPYGLGFIAWKLWRARRPLFRPLAVAAALALLFIVPWLAKNWIWMQNPVTPFANAVFPNPYVHISFERDYRHFLRIYTLTGYRQIPWQVTVNGFLLGGLFGPLYLLAPLALLALKKPAGRQLLLAAGVFALPYFSNIGTRFLIPCAPFLSIALAMAIMNWEWLLIALVLAHAVASWPDVVKLYASQYAWRLAKAPYLEALRIIPEDAFLSRNLPGYIYDRQMERLVPPGARVFALSQAVQSYTSREILVRFLSAPNEVLADILWTPLFPDFQPSNVFDSHFTRRAVRKLRVVKTRDMQGEMWNVSELRVYADGRELPRAPQWRLTAHPNPWDVQLAFDNSQVTRWRTYEAAKPGMRVEIDFGSPRPVDAVRVETQPDWRPADMRVEGMDEAGKWVALCAQWEKRQKPIALNLRRAATAEFKARGIRYLLIGSDDFGSQDFQLHPAYWGIHKIADAGDAKLYYIE